ncbi:Crp/Fnr family transcriptional regulator [Mycolicibacterium sp. XJ1819]
MKQQSSLATAPQAAAVLARVGFIQSLDPAVVVDLASEMKITEVRRGQAFYRQDDPADGLFIILEGKVKVCCRCADGREKLLEIRGPGDVLGAISALDPGPRTSSAIAITDVCAATVDGETLAVWMAEHRQIAEQLVRVLAGRLRRANNHLLTVVFDDVPGRVAKELLALAQRFGVRQGELLSVRHDLTQRELAQLVGATRESVNKALCDFVQRGWITTDGKSTMIHHPELLAKRSG